SCRGIKEGDEVLFIAQITAEDVPQDVDQRQLQVNITTFQDILTLDIQLVAQCDCELPSAPGRQLQSPQCSDVGTHQCGVCQCPEGYYGNHCQC
ncbi:Integrin domain, partial [Trinorchestia longiramus]